MHIKQIISFFTHKIIRFCYLKWKRKRLRNHNFSLIASNCIGACILHDLAQRFNSPFVNLWIEPQDYIKMLKSFPYYMSCELKFIKKEGINHPLGILDDIKLYFQHYKTEYEAKKKWSERVSRINYDNLFIIFTDRDNCSLSDLREFDKLPYPNKVAFVHKPNPDIKSAFYIKSFENDKSVGMLLNYKNWHSIKKYYDDFDYVAWFNSALERK